MTSFFQNKVVVVTGGAGGIGKCIADEFRNEGAIVQIIDLVPNEDYTGDITDQKTLEDFAQTVIKAHGRVDVLVNNAPPLMKGIDTCSYEDFNKALLAGVTAPFYLTKLFAPHFGPGAAVLNLSSSPARISASTEG